jgi:hypothetical protein
VESVVTPVLVLSHDCQLEKDFNERMRELMAGGMDVEEAQGVASSDPTLDPLAVVAALQPYEAFPAYRHAGIRSGDRIGYFPVDRLPQDGGDYAVDLGRLTTISVQLLPQTGKIASLASTSVAELRYKLAEAYSIRDLSVLLELEGMVGQTIQRVEALPRNKKKTSLVLHLANQRGDRPSRDPQTPGGTPRGDHPPPSDGIGEASPPIRHPLRGARGSP